MAARKSWIDAGDLLRRGKVSELLSAMLTEADGAAQVDPVAKTVALKKGTAKAPTEVPAKAPVEAPTEVPAQVPAKAPATGTSGPADRTAVIRSHGAAKPAQGQAPAPQKPAWAAIPRMGEVEHHEPSLASRARPDLSPAADRHSNFSASYLDPNASNVSLRRNNGSLNIAFKGKLANGGGYIAKPHAGIGHRDRFDPDERFRIDDETFQALHGDAPGNAQRHDATYSLMAAMGAHHMVTPGISSNMHGRHQFKGPDPDEDDDEGKRLTMASHHAGGPAHVQELVHDAHPMAAASPEQLDGVDAEHRIHGVMAHVLFGNADGHRGNVMMHKSGHPVLIDHDMTLGSSQASAYKRNYGKKVVHSEFAPGGALDYQAKLPKDEKGQVIPVGSNFPPRMKETLQRAADGYFGSGGDGDLGLSDADHEELQSNARDLLMHGLEGTLALRHDVGAERRAKKAEKEARLAKEGS